MSEASRPVSPATALPIRKKGASPLALRSQPSKSLASRSGLELGVNGFPVPNDVDDHDRAVEFVNGPPDPHR